MQECLYFQCNSPSGNIRLKFELKRIFALYEQTCEDLIRAKKKVGIWVFLMKDCFLCRVDSLV